MTRMWTVLALAAASALASGAAARTVQLRAVHAAYEPADMKVELGEEAGSPLLPPGGVSPWVTVPESEISVSASVTGAPAVHANATASGSRVTAFVYSSLAASGSPLAVYFAWAPKSENVTHAIDKAAVRVLNFAGFRASVFATSSFCFKCVKDRLAPSVFFDYWHVLDVTHDVDVDLRAAAGNRTLASTALSPRQHGAYTWAVLPDPGSAHEADSVAVAGGGYALLALEEVEGDNIAVPLVTAFGVLFAVGVGLRLALYGADRVRKMREDDGVPAGWRGGVSMGASSPGSPAQGGLGAGTGTTPLPASPGGPGGKGRIHSLDTVRGACLVVMIFVNYGGGGYWFFAHSLWNGLTVADLVFPLFVWIMGTSMTLSFAKFSRRAQVEADKAADPDAARGTTLHLALKVLRRGATLFALGLFLNNGYDLRHWRIPGVLQYFAVSFLFCSFLNLLVPQWRWGSLVAPWRSEEGHMMEGVASDSTGLGWSANVNAPLVHRGGSSPRGDGGACGGCFTAAAWSDLLPYWPAWVGALAFPATYLALEFGLPVDGCPTGYIGPGGIGDGGKHPHCTGGAHLAIDRAVFGVQHIYQDPTCKAMYRTGAYDPEGLLGCFNCIFICWLGCQAGRILHHHRSTRARVVRWLAWGLVVGAIGTALCGFTRDGGVIPLNKVCRTPHRAIPSLFRSHTHTPCACVPVAEPLVHVLHPGHGRHRVLGAGADVCAGGPLGLVGRRPLPRSRLQLHPHLHGERPDAVAVIPPPPPSSSLSSSALTPRTLFVRRRAMRS